MTFEKPKVTIDLEEYNFLNKQIEKLSKQEVNENNKMLSHLAGICLERLSMNDAKTANLILDTLRQQGFKVKIDKNNFNLNPLTSIEATIVKL